jgi:hypothetical protein
MALRKSKEKLQMLAELTDVYEAEVETKYSGLKEHEGLRREYEKEIEPVRRAREILKRTG